ncbi:MAG: single-stranded DNA-binding protein [Halanaerobiales bacterium]
MFNQIGLVGRLTRDPEERKVGESRVATFKIACDRDYKDQNGEVPTDFIWVQVWNGTAGFAMGDNGRGIKKGDIVAVGGSLRIDEVDNGNGDYDRYTKVNARTLKLVHQHGDSKQNNSQPKGSQSKSQPANSQNNQSLDDMEMDPPF